MHSLSFSIPELVPYINWVYFYHAWGIPREHGSELRQEAMAVLGKWTEEGRSTVFRVRLFRTNSCNEDILLYEDCVAKTMEDSPTLPSLEQAPPLHTLPLLRQQRPPFLCLADWVPPLDRKSGTIGIFASTVPFPVEGLMEQTVADRLAEATAERGHELVRKQIWAYAPDEKLQPQELFAEHYRGKRPAIGYPSLPDQSLNFLLGDILDFPSMGISLTENGAMIPHASTSGLMLSHPQCRHFSIGTIGEDQLQDYARRRGMEAETLRRFLSVNN